MAKYRWPTDPAGKKPSHSISYEQHLGNLSKQQAAERHTQNQVSQRQHQNQQAASGHIAGQQGGAAPPFDADLAARTSAANQRRTTLLSDQDVDMQQTSQEYGFSYNPATGAFGGFDPTNPFSQAALLMKARKERDQGENTSYASSGQLYSGAYNTAKKETQSGYDKGYDTLRRGFDDYVKNYLRRKRDIQSQPIEELASL